MTNRTCGTCGHALQTVVSCDLLDERSNMAWLHLAIDPSCRRYAERTDSVEQIAREWAVWCGEFDLDAVYFTDRLADLGFYIEALEGDTK